MTDRVYNFGGGPAALPLEVLEHAQSELVNYKSAGMSVMEMSHRSPEYDEIHNQAIESFYSLLNISAEDFSIIFMGGGARTQFVLVPYNLLTSETHGEYLSTGRWSELAHSEASKISNAKKIWSGESERFTRVPIASDFIVDPNSSYLHYTSNNTIVGTQFQDPPASGDVPLISDMTSELMSRPLDMSKFGLIYAAAQKNFGPAGVTAVIIRKDILDRCNDNLPGAWSYKQMDEKNSLLNTPPTFNIYMMGLFLKHLLSQGGLAKIERLNREKAKIMYDAIDKSDNFYRGAASKESRSIMNVTFRLPTEELEQRFIYEAKQNRFVGIKGHRSVGGVRVSIYNASTLEGVNALTDFMGDFRANMGD